MGAQLRFWEVFLLIERKQKVLIRSNFELGLALVLLIEFKGTLACYYLSSYDRNTGQ